MENLAHGFIDNSSKRNKVAKLELLTVAILWGSSLTVVKNAANNVPPNMILCFRFTIASLILIIIFRHRLRSISVQDLKSGFMIGLFLFLAYSSQTLGVTFTAPGRSGFLSASYCIIVPFIERIFLKKKTNKYNLISAVICIAGIFFISFDGFNQEMKLSKNTLIGDSLALLSGVLFASHIVAVEKYGAGHDPIIMTILQFITAALLSLVTTLTFETKANAVIDAKTIAKLLYLAIFCTAIALLLQNIGQKYTDAATSSIILSMESLFGVIIPVLLGIEQLTVTLAVGCALILAAIIISNLLCKSQCQVQVSD